MQREREVFTCSDSGEQSKASCCDPLLETFVIIQDPDTVIKPPSNGFSLAIL